MKKIQYVLASLLAASVFTTAAEAANFNNEVKTQQGVVAGAYDDKHQVVQWLGVPYAQQPTGADRWREAQQAKKHKGILDCTKAVPANIQYNGKKVLGQEGMLTLDIVRPDTQEKNLPVLVYIHGGNNQASNSHLMEGNKLAQEGNMVYVSVQYRLGLFGFNNLPALTDGNKKEQSGNFGFLDQAAALDWVRENIKEFGGDAKNITVSGFSAGGRDVMAMLISPVFKNKFDKAISFSGGLTVADADKSKKTIAQKLAPMVVEDGKQNNLINAENWLLSDNGKDKKAVRQYLQAMPAERLAPVMAGAVIRMSAFPHLYGDGEVLPVEGFATKHYYSVPLLMLASADEFSSFAARDPFFKDRLNLINNDYKTTSEFKFANKYGSALYGFFNGQQSAEVLYPHYKADMYVCSFAFGHTADVVGKEYMVRNGALHGIFQPFLTDQGYGYTKNTDAFEQAGSKELSKAFIASIAAFVRTGNPNTPALGTTWQAWNPTYRPELVWDANRQHARISSINSRVSYAGILAEMANDKSINEQSKNYIIQNVLNGRWFSGELDAQYGNPSL
ncbi:carboxylesterase family protein [Phascolarctobacterium sp.]|uniref:carboxylesterase family protein n=1 Tax=Phascolarctobacterium sp. TaxID=2049039 RepID=UPI0025F80191|nr:carboxylesterase family protein [Phascolarctobacterium sp.]